MRHPSRCITDYTSRMSWSYRLIRIAGTDVKVHVTFVLLLIWQGLAVYPTGGAEAVLITIGLIIAVFTCVLLHEFGHIFMARRFGIRTPDVILLPIGGVARLERMPEQPKQELLIAIAGPLVTLLIALGFYFYLRLQGAVPALVTLEFGDDSAAGLLMHINVMLLLFNLLPAFPMDGGRVLRSLLAMKWGFPRATRTAAAVGQFMAMTGGMYGLVSNHFILVLIAFFVFLGAGAELAAVEHRTAGRGMLVRDMMMTRFQVIPIHASLEDAVRMLLEGDQKEFPVLDNGGRIEGMLSRENLIKGLAARGPRSTVQEAMTPNVAVLSPDLDFEHALEILRASRIPALPVVGPGGELTGILSTDNVAELIQVKRAMERDNRR
jgi:Zn-dependent protease/predicted transcriptional regulator